MSEQASTNNIDISAEQSNDMAMESQNATPRQRPARYRTRTSVAPTPLSSTQSSPSSLDMPRPPISGGVDYFTRRPTQGLQTPLQQRRYTPTPTNELNSAGFMVPQHNFGNVNHPILGPRENRRSYAAPIGSSQSPLSPENHHSRRQVVQAQMDNVNRRSSSIRSPITQRYSASSDLRVPLPSEQVPAQRMYGGASGFGYTGNDRSTLPSQRQQAPHISSSNRQNISSLHGPGARMINVPQTQNHSTVGSLARSPKPVTNQHASMRMLPPMDFGTSSRNNLSQSNVVESISMPNFDVGAAPPRGHRRNKTTVSHLSDVYTRNAPHDNGAKTIRAVGGDIDMKVSNSKRATLPAFSFGSSAADLDELTNNIDGFADMNLEEKIPTRSSRPNEQRGKAPRPKHEHMQSNDSSSTVASDSWNVVDPTSAPPKKETGLRFDLETGMPSVVGASFMRPETLTSTEARRRYPLDEFVHAIQAGKKHGVRGNDFAYPKGTPSVKKHVRFASHSDYAPSMHYPSGSEDSTASTRAKIDLVKYAGSANDRRTGRAVLQRKGKDKRTTVMPRSALKTPAKQQNNPSGTGEERTRKAGEKDQQHKRHKHSSSLDLLSRASDSVIKFVAARAGIAPVQKDGALDRGFQFPARDDEQRVSSTPDLREIGGKKGSSRKRSGSLSRLLEGFGLKKPTKDNRDDDE
ncbi:uncharacterized protein K460DRAFT_405135 [Cucurbitaria berberidis CBS 394.84]|uniref:Pal1-domain-containing protein n=1 Tax=Cucurbitaria berberidis CBS 394.84 TaxID=1168544 RepID=A0A9P4GGQ4_9PLEO|nr:uncharacterized protein K460DRAFT_405135 [Cucurbitaria berberidis CBS 394.84]KAF1844855.1 hypothetical protein K460DRAFT_405135 [Cucurbitaria berberidis CBS 394.84]